MIGQVGVATGSGEAVGVEILDLEQRPLMPIQFILRHQFVQADSHMPLPLAHVLFVIE